MRRYTRGAGCHVPDPQSKDSHDRFVDIIQLLLVAKAMEWLISLVWSGEGLVPALQTTSLTLNADLPQC
jgi:hypothetical protein